MKTKFLLIALATFMLMPLLGQAQTMKVNIPFDFNVDNNHMPAGNYIFKVANDSTLLIYLEDGTSARFSLTGPVAEKTRYRLPRLAFWKSGEKYDLRAAWFGNGDRGRELMTATEPRNRESVEIALAD